MRDAASHGVRWPEPRPPDRGASPGLARFRRPISSRPPSTGGSRMGWELPASPTCQPNGPASTRCSALLRSSGMFESSGAAVAPFRKDESEGVAGAAEMTSWSFSLSRLQIGNDLPQQLSSSCFSRRTSRSAANRHICALSAPPSQGITAENSSQKRSSFLGSEHCWAPRPAAEADGSRTTASCHRLRCEVSIRWSLGSGG